ncbi:CAP domain-containing protein [Acidicapsa ligni]|uniref:CAP domain-containing protein n=1 Tax=Acidicapsa ligni TaxID=542300 RepID=UPI0021E084CD|nr:CAP domain-containing protein [Acidicapsa ligni]
MRLVKRFAVLLMASSVGVCGVAALAQDPVDVEVQAAQEQKVVDLANQARVAEGLPALVVDPGLAAAARAHAELMSKEGPISHRYGGEPDVAERTSKAGAHFSLVEENIAIGDSPKQVHEEWMKSDVHHANLMNAKIDRIGVGIVSAHHVLYAVADYSVSVQSMDAGQIEGKIGAMLTGKGLTLLSKAEDARKYCALQDGEAEGTPTGMKPLFLMRWQSADLSKLPPQLEERIASGKYKQAAVGSCPAQGSGGNGGATFAAYRVAVLLY